MRIKSLSLVLLSVFILPALSSATTLHWISDISMTPQSPKSGDTVTIQAKIGAGRQDEVDFKILAGIDGQQIFNRSFKLLNAGKSRFIRFRYKALAGKHLVYFRIVPKGRTVPQSQIQQELVKTNKKKSRTPLLISKQFNVDTQKLLTTIKPKELTPAKREQPVCEGRPLPDIITTDLSLHNVYRPGDLIEVQAVFENRGQCNTGVFNVRLEVYVQDFRNNRFEHIEIGKKLLRSMEPCRESRHRCPNSTVSVNMAYQTLNVPDVYYEFSAFPNFDHKVEEYNEENNDWDRKTTITIRNH